MTAPTKPRGVPADTIQGNLKNVKASPAIKAHELRIKLRIPSIYTPADKEADKPEDFGSVWSHVDLQFREMDSETWVTIPTDQLYGWFRVHRVDQGFCMFRLKRKTPDIDIYYTLHRPAGQVRITLSDKEIADIAANKAEHEATKADRLKVSTIEAIKAECETRILKVAPISKQINYTAEVAQMNAYYGNYQDWPEQQQQRGTELQDVFNRINALREASNAIEAKLEGKTFEQLQAFDINSGWPE